MFDKYPEGDPEGKTVEQFIKQYGLKQINFNAIKIENYTDEMFKIMDQEYYKVTRKHIQFTKLGSGNINF